MVSEELYNLLKALNKKYKYIGYDKEYKDEEVLVVSVNKLTITKNKYFKDIWEYDYRVISRNLFPCLYLLVESKDAKLYKIDELLYEYEQMLIDEKAVECLRELGGEE